MYKFILPVLFVNFFLTSQETFTLIKTDPNQIILDGIIDPDEWSNAIEIDFDIEFSPANNEPSRIKTFGYISYSKEFIYVGIDAKVDPKNITDKIGTTKPASIKLSIQTFFVVFVVNCLKFSHRPIINIVINVKGVVIPIHKGT